MVLGTMHFSLARQRRHIESHGELALVLPALQCPCLLDDHQFDPVCTSCHGTGRFYPPNTAYTTMLLLVREHSSRTFQDPGTWIPGTIQASILPGVQLSDRDKVRRLDITETFTDEVLTRGLDETLRFPSGVRLLLVADREYTYRAGTDYVLTPPHTVTWVASGQGPAFGAQYSVRYAANPDYLVTPDNPRSRVEHRTAQAQVVLLQRLDYVAEGL